MIGCSQEVEENKNNQDAKNAVVPLIVNDSTGTDKEDVMEPDIGDWKPGGSERSDLTEQGVEGKKENNNRRQLTGCLPCLE